MQWFRLHDDVLDDPKVQRLSPALFKHWINLLCLASKNNPRGTLPDLITIAFRLRLTEDKASKVLEELTDAGLLDTSDDGAITPHNWKSRQYGKPSDDPERVSERVRKHRESQRNADVTPLKRAETPLYTDTDTDTDTDTEQTEANASVPPKPPKGERTRQVKTPVPDDLDIPVDEWQRMGREQRMSDADLRRETEAMKDHFRAKGERRVDWVATWRNWMRSPYRKTTPVSEADRIYQAFVNGAAAPPGMETR